MNQFFVPIAGKFVSEQNAKFSKCGDLYFVSEPDYSIFTSEELDGYRYLKQNDPPHDVAVVIRTSNVSKMLKEYIKLPVNQYNLSDETIGKIKKGVDLRILDIKDVVEICDTLLEFDRVDVFELLYMNGNFPIDEYIKESKYPTVKFLKYIEDPIKNHSKTISTIKAEITLKKFICARQLKISTEDTCEMVQIKLIDHSCFDGLYDTHRKLEILFSLGAIALTKEQIEKINKGRHPEYYPTIKELHDAIRFNTNIKTVGIHPYKETTSNGVIITKSQQTKSTKTATQEQKTQTANLNEKKQEQARQQKEAEDQIDKIFAEAQKNVEEGCEK